MDHQLYPVESAAMGLRENQCPRHMRSTATTSTTTSVDEGNEWVITTNANQTVEDGENLPPTTIVEGCVTTSITDHDQQQAPQRFNISNESNPCSASSAQVESQVSKSATSSPRPAQSSTNEEIETIDVRPIMHVNLDEETSEGTRTPTNKENMEYAAKMDLKKTMANVWQRSAKFLEVDQWRKDSLYGGRAEGHGSRTRSWDEWVGACVR